jgi:hypothetical protein
MGLDFRESKGVRVMALPSCLHPSIPRGTNFLVEFFSDTQRSRDNFKMGNVHVTSLLSAEQCISGHVNMSRPHIATSKVMSHRATSKMSHLNPKTIGSEELEKI